MNKLSKYLTLGVLMTLPVALFSACANGLHSSKEFINQSSHASTPYIKQLPPEVVKSVDLSRYAGTWHEVARLPMYFQRKCVSDVTATYKLDRESKDDSKVTVINACKKQDGTFISSEGVAVPANKSGSKLNVTFLPKGLRWLPVGKANYWILALDDDYKNAMVGTPDRKYLWLLSRNPVMDKATYKDYLNIAKRQGYELEALKVSPEQSHEGT